MTFDDDSRRPDADADAGSSSPYAGSGGHWWSSLPAEVECPITLEPIRSLPYPPFVLPDRNRDGEARGGGDRGPVNDGRGGFHFDGMALASYVVSRGTFHNPLTREPLGGDDCLRLDDHLERYHYRDGGDNGGDFSVAGGGGDGRMLGRIRVAEARALRESLRVRSSAESSSSVRREAGEGGAAAQARAEAEAEARRIEALRSEAAAALRGLFSYGSADSGHPGGGDGAPRRRRRNRGAAYVDVASPNHRPGSVSAPVPSVGFDLNGRRRGIHGGGSDEEEGMWVMDGNAAVNRVAGLRIVDDSLAVGEAADGDEWDEVQRSFPRLVDVSDEMDDDAAAAPRSVAGEDGGELLRIARETAEQTRMEEERRRAALAERRLREERAAARRREGRAQEKVELRTKAAVEHEQKMSREKEMALARAEIDRWRERQWRGWAAEGGGCDAAASSSPPDSRPGTESSPASADAGDGGEVSGGDDGAERRRGDHDDDAAEEDPVRRKKEREAAKRAAKRKKARERQRAKRAAEAVERERRAAAEELRARREAAALRCGRCGGGILDGVGFEKFGTRFCSTGCARSGPRGA